MGCQGFNSTANDGSWSSDGFRTQLENHGRCEVKHGQGGDGSIGSKWSLFLEKGLGLERHQVAMPVTSMPVASVQTGVPMSDDSLGNPRLKE